MKKRYHIMPFLLLLLIALSLCLVACEISVGGDGEHTADTHQHSFSLWSITTEPTCTATGMQTRVCASCGFSEYSAIPVVPHTEAADEAVAATCTADGKTAGSHCSVCHTVIVPQTVVKAAGHVEVADEAVAPTCATEGKSAGSHCDNCGVAIVPQLPIAAKGHQYDNGTVIDTADCTVAGSKLYTCTVANCRHTYTAPYSLSTYTAAALYETAIKYVAEVVVYDGTGAELGLGTGVVYSSDGKIITNYHVIDGAQSATVTIGTARYTVTSVLAYDANIDLAILQIDATELTAATVCKKPVRVGDPVYAIGSSRGMTNTYSQGIVTYANRVVRNVAHVQHDASITHGNSGGPLINAYGEVIGINTWCIADSQNLNFAVFVSELDNLVYGAPQTLAEVYAQNHDPDTVLLNWLQENYNASSGSTISFEYDHNVSTFYSISYDRDDARLYIDVLRLSEDGAQMQLQIDFSQNGAAYQYSAKYSANGYPNITTGTITAASFTESTALTVTSYTGTHWNRSQLLELYRKGIVDLLEWYEWCATQNSIGIGLCEWGFTAFAAS